LAFGAVGFLDDYLIVTRGKNLGLKARQKLAMQFVLAAGFMVIVYMTAASPRTWIHLWRDIDFGPAYYAMCVLLIVGMSNAVNFADGLDGLAGGISALIAGALLGMVHGVAGLPFFGGAVAGACAGFLWYNAHPAQVFMGDTGSLALGAGLA